jgi:hypothetical protein
VEQESLKSTFIPAVQRGFTTSPGEKKYENKKQKNSAAGMANRFLHPGAIQKLSKRWWHYDTG